MFKRWFYLSSQLKASSAERFIILLSNRKLLYFIQKINLLLLFYFGWSPIVQAQLLSYQQVDTFTHHLFKMPIDSIHLDSVKWRAEIATSFRLKYLHLYENRVVLSITAVMDTTQSWLHPASRNHKRLIKHEQLHFAISELWARRLRQLLHGKTYLKSDYQRLVYEQHLTTKAAWEAMQKRYDKETKHGTNREAQETWQARVEADLLLLEEFESVLVSIWLD